MSTPITPRRAAIYARISRDKTGAGLGVERQIADCQALADRLGLSVTSVLSDNDLSAYSGKIRPGYRRLLATIETGTVDVVLCWHTDRLHRSPVELEQWIATCDPRGIEVHTVKAGPLDLATPSGRMVARQLGAVARYESEHRSERVSAAMDAIARSGGYLGGPRPFGYLAGGMALDPIEAPMVADATRAVLAGRSLRSIVKAWNSAEIRTTVAKRQWTPLLVADVLRRPRNAALVEHRGQVIGPAKWAPIVSKDEWAGVCAVLNDPARRTSPGRQPRWLGSMLYLCGPCGEVMVVGTSGTHRSPSYRCRSADRGGARHVTRAAQQLDEYISGLIVERLSRPDAADFFTNRPADVDVAAIRADLAGIDEQRNELGARLGRGEISLTMLDAANGPLRARQVALETALAAAMETNPVAEVATVADIAGTWAGLDLDLRRKILDTLMTVTIMPSARGGVFRPESIKVVWRT